jgi:ribosomal protein L37AE/L43A
MKCPYCKEEAMNLKKRAEKNETPTSSIWFCDCCGKEVTAYQLLVDYNKMPKYSWD